MKKYFSLIVLAVSLYGTAQSKITFDYDAAGNQIKRELCINCTKAGYRTKKIETVEEITEQDLEKFSPEDEISYYPNPVKEELYLKWQLVPNKVVNTVYLYAMNGQVLRTFGKLDKANTLNIPFFSYPTGTYLVVLLYNDGEQKTIKIVK